MKTILVVGGSKGIGKALVNKLANSHNIIMFSRSALKIKILFIIQ